MDHGDTHRITDTAALEALYGTPSEASLIKEVGTLHPHYAAFVRASPFAILATVGPDGVDVSPRGDGPGFIAIENDTTLLLPDRRGNNRTDSLRNIIADPRVALLFLVPGVGETLRVNGRGSITVDPKLLERFSVDGKPPRSVLDIRIGSVFFQCSRAVVRGELWSQEKHLRRSALPSTGTILADLSRARFDGEAYDRGLDARVLATLY